MQMFSQKKYRFLDRTSIFVHLLLKMNENYQKISRNLAYIKKLL